METTRAEKNDMLKRFDRMAWSIAWRCGSKKDDDIEEVHNSCLMAMSRAIDAFVPTAGSTIEGLAFRYAEQARRNWYKMNVSPEYGGKQRRMENSGIPLDEELASALECGEDSLSALSLSVVFDRALRDGVINKRMHTIFLHRITGLLRRDIGEILGVGECRIGQLEREGIRRIRESYEGKL